MLTLLWIFKSTLKTNSGYKPTLYVYNEFGVNKWHSVSTAIKINQWLLITVYCYGLMSISVDSDWLV